MTDSYKASHFLQYPSSRKMVAVSIQQTQQQEQQSQAAQDAVTDGTFAAASSHASSTADCITS
jgi:hypothetical protein